ncbi:MAG: PIN domain-containing protein [Candidatus Latescibacterota bacterium]|jgi:predicted nucleic acid-binding protein
MSLCLIDTSAWVHALRPDGDAHVAALVRNALESGEASWCPIVQLELWNGARGEHEKGVLTSMAKVLPELAIDGTVWSTAWEMAKQARARGITAPATDILVLACSQRHGIPLVHADGHFDLLMAV